MDIKKLAEESGICIFKEGDIRGDEGCLELFAQKIREARDAEWMAEPVAFADEDGDMFSVNSHEKHGYGDIPLFAKPKGVK